MSRITTLFSKKQQRILNIYCTAGYPERDSTVPVMEAIQEAGADLIELGMPYSDPLADGPVIQDSSMKALRNGMTITRMFEQLEGFRSRIHLPVVLMGYLNPILQYGFERFCAKAAELGIDGLIVPDIPSHAFEREYGDSIRKQDLDFIFLVTPETTVERVRKLDALSTGFLYAVSASSTTGSGQDVSAAEVYLQKLQGMKLKNPVLVGFGIKDKKSFDAACRWANGAIIGSAFIRAIGEGRNLKETIHTFVEGIRK